MLSKRVIPCLDVRDGKLTKGIKFKGNVDIGDPVEMARIYYEEGADELVFYDITASSEGRGIMLDVVDKVASQIFIPFSVGGGHLLGRGHAGGPSGRRGKSVGQFLGRQKSGHHQPGRGRLRRPVRGGGHGRQAGAGVRHDPFGV